MVILFKLGAGRSPWSTGVLPGLATVPLRSRSSSASRKNVGSDAAAVAEALAAGLDPMTLVTGGTQTELQETGKKKGKKKKKLKMTRAEKAMAKVEKQCEDLKKSGAPFLDYVRRMDQWLKSNHKKAVTVFKAIDTDGEGYVTFDEFKAVMNDLSVPCSIMELHMLCQLLDKEDTEEINYQNLADGLKGVRERELAYTEVDVNPGLVETKRQLPHCAGCKLAVWDGEPYRPEIPRYIEVLFRLVTFEGYKAHPGHFSKVVPSHVTGLSLLETIQRETGVQSTQLALFTDKTREADVLVDPKLTLEESGFHGGPMDEPPELLLYYDYRVEFTDCPILLCDHYFGQKVKI